MLQERDPGRTPFAFHRLDVAYRSIRPRLAGYERQFRGRKPPKLFQSRYPAARLFCAVAFFETSSEFGDPLAEIWGELVVFEVFLEHLDHLWCSSHRGIRLADGPVQETTNIFMVEREPVLSTVCMV